MAESTGEQDEPTGEQGERTGAGASVVVDPVAAPVADEVLLNAVDVAREALYEITPAATVGAPAGHLVEGERVLSLLFENTQPGYPGWYWTVSLSREPDSDAVNVLEAELMPGDDAVLAPDWVPWADRLAEYQAQKKAEREAAEAAGEPGPGDEEDLDDEDLEDEDLDEDGDELDESEDLDDEDELDEDELDEDDDFDDEVDEPGYADDELEEHELEEDELADELEFDESEDLQGAETAALASDDEA